MSIQADQNTTESLRRLVTTLDSLDLVIPDRWLGKRRAPRSRLLVPNVVRIIPTTNPASGFSCELRDISDLGMGVAVPCELEPYQQVLVELQVNDTRWKGGMYIIYCAQSVSGYRIGLVCDDTGSFQEEPPIELLPEESDEATGYIANLKTEIRAAIRSYRRAQLSWGLLGSSLQKRISHVIATLPPASEEANTNSRRKQPRRPVAGDVQVVIPSQYRWKHLPGRIDDISNGGARLLIPIEVSDDPIERELIGDFGLRPRMILMVGVETADETLWLPSRIIHCIQDNATTLLGVAFLNGPALQNFEP